MERIPAASAVDWSIELDRGLRSRHQATRVRALDAAGPRLRQLCSCTTAPPPIASAYGVLPGEARVFAETMLLRLATEFRTADGAMRARIVRTLLAAAGGRGALAGARVAEPDQLLRRVKAVYDTGSARGRALALRLFGCLADIARDSVHVRSLVLSSLGATDALEVKAAIFAAGCICHLSEDFSRTILEVFRRVISSRSSEAQVIVAAIKAFSKLDCTLAVIHRVHEVGKQMVLGTLEDVFKSEMLYSLSRLSSKSTILFSDQVDVLLLFLDHDSSSMRSAALKCMHFMFRRNTCHFPVVRTVFGRLLPLIDDEDFPLDCKSDVLRILQKMFCGKVPNIHHINGSELSMLLRAAESSLHSSSLEMQDTALEILVQIFCVLKEMRPDDMIVLKDSSFGYAEWKGVINNTPLTSEENDMNRPLCKVITMIVNHIISLVNQAIGSKKKKDNSGNTCILFELDNKYRTPFRLMMKLVTCYPSAAAAVALDKLRGLVKELSQINGSDSNCEVTVTSIEPFQTCTALEESSTSNNNAGLLATSIEASCIETCVDNRKLDSIEFDRKNKRSITHDLILCTLKFANACQEVLCRTSSSRYDSHDSIKCLVECVHQNAPQHWSTYETFHLIMCACIARNTCKIRDGNQEPCYSEEQPNIFFTPSIWIAQELCALRMTKMLIKKQKYWEAYRSSMYCCHRGLWFTASFVFRKLADAFEPGLFSFWFKSLLLLSAGEIEMKLLLFPSATTKLVGELKMEGDFNYLYCTEIDTDSMLSRSSDLHGSQPKIAGICGRISLANDALASSASSDRYFSFQRWFISLRSSFLEVLTDVLAILTAHSYKARGDHLTVSRELVEHQILALDHCSLRLSDLAKSYDLLAASHMDMDQHSFSSIARLAFMCSLLAFCTAYSVDFSKVYRNVEPCKLPKRLAHASILQDLYRRVDGSDWQIVSQLRQFISISFDELDCLQSSTRMSYSSNLEKASYSLCHFAVSSLLRLRGNVNSEETKNEEDCASAFHGGLQFLSSILQKFMELPFVVPRYFFRVRPCLGAELYFFDSNPTNRNGISVEPGFQLSLTICMKWKCVLERTAIRLVKLYCILAASSEAYIDAAETRSKQFDPHRTAEMVQLNSKLLQYINSDLRKAREPKKNFHSGMDMVTAFACFEPTDSGQGFSGCLLDVSSFPEGSYQIKWHACCVDENGSYFSLLPLNHGAIFSVHKS
ncbi:hypothetical protein U9M48_020411 [Paspalum notatum var. saurae]|uniref:ARM repeat superfamily protein n=1 Tax=Paspalum notatum var. saurae TaxID=547442 RepID=A0AAQ3TDA9_PASNO